MTMSEAKRNLFASRMPGLDETRVQLFRSFSVGSLAGMAGKVVEMPFDTIKVRLQTQGQIQVAGVEPFLGPLDCFRKTMKSEGFRALYRGLASPLLGSALDTAVIFCLYEEMKHFISARTGRTLQLSDLCLAGAATGIFTGLILTPIELIKCRIQAQRRGIVMANIPSYAGTLDCIKQTIHTDGITGLFRGGISTIVREVPGNALWFGGYEFANEFLRYHMGDSSPKGSPTIQVLAGAFAGCMYWLVPYPIDTVKTRIQTQSQLEPHGGVFWKILEQEGIAGLYRGVGLTMFRAIPSSAAVFFTYEQIHRLLTQT